MYAETPALDVWVDIPPGVPLRLAGRNWDLTGITRALRGFVNAGRGPVDFKFSQGWSARTVVEIKLMSNTKFWDGFLAQTPEYAMAEEVMVAFFVAVAHVEKDLDADQLAKVTRAAELVAAEKGIDVIPVVIDARRKDSASKLKAPKETKDQLHRKHDGDDPDGDAEMIA